MKIGDDVTVELDDIDSLAEALDEELPGDETDGTPVEDPPESDEDEEQEQVLDDDDPDADDSDDDEDSDEEDEEDPDAEDDDEELNPKTLASMTKRIDTLTAKYKAEEERAMKLEEELEAAEKLLKAGPKVEVNGKAFGSVADVEKRDAELESLIAELEDDIQGLPVWDRDEDGNRVEATVEIRGATYSVKAVREHLRNLQKEQRSLPDVRKQIEAKMADDAKARRLLPQAWKRGTKAYDVRKQLVKEFPGLAQAETGALVAAITGRLALMRQSERKVVAKVKKPGAGKPAAGRGVKPDKKKSERKAKVSSFMQVDGIDPEIAELAAALDD